MLTVWDELDQIDAEEIEDEFDDVPEYEKDFECAIWHLLEDGEITEDEAYLWEFGEARFNGVL